MIVVSLFAWLMSVGAQPQRAPQLPTDAMARTTWMIGCWQTENKLPEAMRVEWRRVSPTLTIGVVSSGPQGLFGSIEYVRMSAVDGTVTYVSSQPGRAPERLTLEVSTAADTVRFKGANDRDVTWRRVKEKDALVSLVIDGKRTDVPLKRKDCD